MRFTMFRNRTVASTCGLSIEFKKGEPHLVPPQMYAEVIAAGGVSEEELREEDLPPAPATPEQLAERKQAMLKAFDTIVRRQQREDFTAGGVPHASVLGRELGWAVQAKERDAAWVEYTAGKGD